MKTDNKSLFAAIALSLVVLVGWNYLYGVPQIEKSHRAAAEQSQGGAQGPGQGSGSVSTPLPNNPGGGAPTAQGSAAQGTVVVETREQALEKSPRIVIDTPKIAGSIALKGARIDDVSLKSYHETIDPLSANIVLLSPTGGPNPYYAEFGWVGETGTAASDLPSSSTLWTADKDRLTSDAPVTLTATMPGGLVFKRTISVDANAMFTVAETVQNPGAQPVTLHPYGLISRHGKPVTLGYYILHEGLIGRIGDQGLKEYKYDALDKEALVTANAHGVSFKSTAGGFAGITDKYWATALIPDQAVAYDARFSTSQGDVKTYQTDILGSAVTVAPGAETTATTRLFAGAKETALLEAYEKDLGIKSFDLLIDWGWFYFITKPLFHLLDAIYRLVGNFGIAILAVTVLVKGIFFPLANRSYASMAKMKAVQPETVAIRERFADDKMKQQQALMELYKREKINPLAGCWPVLVQIPVFFALYKVLFTTIEMRHAPFFGWIKDLAAPDPTSVFNLFGLLPLQLPHALMVGAWPMIMGVTMFLQMKMNPQSTDPVQKTMFTWMPVVFTFMLASFPAGLVIYWSWNNLLSVLQQAVIMRRSGVKLEIFDNIRHVFGSKPAVDR